LQRTIESKNISRGAKIRIQSTIRPVVLYACERWTLVDSKNKTGGVGRKSTKEDIWRRGRSMEKEKKRGDKTAIPYKKYNRDCKNTTT
jgi:hypothetical protein